MIYAIELAKKGTLEYFRDYMKKKLLKRQKENQLELKPLVKAHYIQAMKRNDLVFGIGPAGTGKTYLAVVMAINALKNGKVKRIILTRPAVEAGESLDSYQGI